jgi:hypothetical protein
MVWTCNTHEGEEECLQGSGGQARMKETAKES